MALLEVEHVLWSYIGAGGSNKEDGGELLGRLS